ncbi:hypothetical protein [Embleya scabrispora]|uniref:hypothetical protein n=1 Tax=Embleya scabrispora TaxID=159449 RepID=UPI00117F53CE|nr:hypothetical protein [Embleya scabrispora]
MGNPRCAARCLLVVCVCLPVLVASGAAFEASADDAVAVIVPADGRPPDGNRPGAARTEVHAGRVHVVYQPGVVTSVRIGDDVAVTVRPGCRCPSRPATPPPASRPSRPPSSHPPSTERAPAAPIRTGGPPPAAPAGVNAPARTHAPVEAIPTPEPPNTRAPSAEPPPASRPSRPAAAPPDDAAAGSGFADGFAPALIVSILPAALAALLPGPSRRGVRP